MVPYYFWIAIPGTGAFPAEAPTPWHPPGSVRSGFSRGGARPVAMPTPSQYIGFDRENRIHISAPNDVTVAATTKTDS